MEPLTWLEYIELMITFLQGKKVYLLGVAAILYAVGGYFTGHFDLSATTDMLWAALTAMGLRAGISKAIPPNV